MTFKGDLSKERKKREEERTDKEQENKNRLAEVKVEQLWKKASDSMETLCIAHHF